MSIKEKSLVTQNIWFDYVLVAQSHEAGHMAFFFCSTFLIPLFLSTSWSHF